jgi:hypothetical protein
VSNNLAIPVEELTMSEAGTAEPNSDPLKAVADAMEAAVEAAKEGAADARETAERMLPVAGGMLATFAYKTCYAISYGVVFPSVLIARSVPQDNPVVHGLVDGARAARDMVEEMKARNELPQVESGPSLPTEGEHPAAPAVS